MAEMENITNDRRLALVTGSTRSIGRAIAQELGRLGYAVLIHGRTRESAFAAAAELQAEGMAAFGVYGDFTEPGSIARLVEQVRQHHDRLHVLVNNAAVHGCQPLRRADLIAAFRSFPLAGAEQGGETSEACSPVSNKHRARGYPPLQLSPARGERAHLFLLRGQRLK